MLVFGFSGTVAEKIANNLRGIADVKIIQSDKDYIEHFVAATDFRLYDYILGMGAYSGRDNGKIRIEAVCSSQFRNDKHNLKTRNIPYFIQEGGVFKVAAKGIGNSWCNLVSYKILSKSPKIKYTFLHIPKTFDEVMAIVEIQRVVSNLGDKSGHVA